MPVDAAEWLAENASSYAIQRTSRAGPSRARLVAVVNSHSGACKAQQLWDDVVAPLLGYALPSNIGFDGTVQHTESAGDGERIGRELRQPPDATTDAEEERLVLLVLGGDGTVHEVLNGLLLDQDGKEKLPAGRAELVLIPTGTANALYYHSFPPESPAYPADTPASPFYSLLSFLRVSTSSADDERKARLRPVALALNTLPVTSSPSPSARVVTSVVSSAALHACLLHDAEELRETHPGLERFKLAAQKNVQRWWDGSVQLRGNVRVYDPAKRDWTAGSGVGQTTLQGPFAYFVTAVASRFEQSFVVAPFRNAQHPLAPRPGEPASVDVVCIRPERHGPTKRLVQAGRAQEARDAWVQRIWDVTGGMYSGGQHVDLTYSADELAEEGADADAGRALSTEAVVEVFRCEALEWLPSCKEDDLKSRLVCLDGALHDLGGTPAPAGQATTPRCGLGIEAFRSGGGASAGVSIWT
ncbi:hypothetical protein JCM3774_005374 [Rhodotorula dairenensis]